MPRSRKTSSGSTAQPVEAITGQQYGRAVQQEALQRSMPVPNEAVQAQGTAPQGAAPATAMRPRLAPEQAMSLLSGMGGILSAPDDNPNIPITDGLTTGPGRGPEVMRNQSALGDTLRRLAMQTNDPVFSRLASKVNI